MHSAQAFASTAEMSSAGRSATSLAGANILHKHSINSLLEQHDLIDRAGTHNLGELPATGLDGKCNCVCVCFEIYAWDYASWLIIRGGLHPASIVSICQIINTHVQIGILNLRTQKKCHLQIQVNILLQPQPDTPIPNTIAHQCIHIYICTLWCVYLWVPHRVKSVSNQLARI